ncbi:hypothetical protein DIPPA_17183 [Diplonema papillatum]|nr:hypothetical protein DIPPA_17183 [Diplonema papillatum]
MAKMDFQEIMACFDSATPSTFSTPEEKELARLQRLERELGVRIGLRLRELYHPNLEGEQQQSTVSKEEWQGRRGILLEEDQRVRLLCLRHHTATKLLHTEKRCRFLQARGVDKDAGAITHDRVTGILKQLTAKYDQLIDAKNASGIACRNMIKESPEEHAESERMDKQIEHWQAARRAEEERKQAVVRELLKTSAPTRDNRGGAGIAGGGAGGGREEARPEGAGGHDADPLSYAAASRSLRALQEEQAAAEAHRSEGVNSLLMIGAFTFRLTCRDDLEVITGGVATVLSQRMSYEPSSGLLVSGNFSMVVPSHGKADYERQLIRLADAAHISHNIGMRHLPGFLQLKGGDNEEDPPVTEAPAGLLEYVLMYRCPGVRRRRVGKGARFAERSCGDSRLGNLAFALRAALRFLPDGTPAGSLAARLSARGARQKQQQLLPLPQASVGSSSAPRARRLRSTAGRPSHMAVETRKAIFWCLPYLDEVVLQLMKRVCREIFALVEDAVGAAERRKNAMKRLVDECAVDFVQLAQRCYRLGIPDDELREKTRPAADGGVELSEDRPITFHGLGDECVDFMPPTTYEETGETWVTEVPVTVGQWRLIAAAFPHVAHLVTPDDIRLSAYNTITPADNRNARLTKKHAPRDETGSRAWFVPRLRGETVAPSTVLELPYETAAKIAACLSGTLPTWQQWEAGVRGVDGRRYPWGNSVSEVTIALESLPLGWAVNNPRQGLAADNGYVELADTVVDVRSVHRAGQLPAAPEEDVTGGTAGRVAPAQGVRGQGSSRRRSKIALEIRQQAGAAGAAAGEEQPRAYQLHAGSRHGLWAVHEAPRVDSAVTRLLDDGTTIFATVTGNGWLCLADRQGWVKQQQQGVGWQEVRSRAAAPDIVVETESCESDTPEQSPHGSARTRPLGVSFADASPAKAAAPLGGSAKQLQLPAIAAAPPDAESIRRMMNSLGMKHRLNVPDSDWAEREAGLPRPGLLDETHASSSSFHDLDISTAAKLLPAGRYKGRGFKYSCSDEPVLKGAARLGKEWNLATDQAKLMVSGKPLHDRVLRSVSDLFSKQDVCCHRTSLPRTFYATNHRAFSGPPAFCMIREPGVLPMAERRDLLRRKVDESDENLGVPPPAGGEVGVQVRLRGHGRRRFTGTQQPRFPTPVRAAFRLAFVATGLAQVHPCRPCARHCARCQKTYYYVEDCPTCTEFNKLLASYGVSNCS